MDEPIDPRDIKISNIKKEGAIPTRGIKTIDRKVPPRTNKRVR
jgi:hypothetical protein